VTVFKPSPLTHYHNEWTPQQLQQFTQPALDLLQSLTSRTAKDTLLTLHTFIQQSTQQTPVVPTPVRVKYASPTAVRIQYDCKAARNLIMFLSGTSSDPVFIIPKTLTHAGALEFHVWLRAENISPLSDAVQTIIADTEQLPVNTQTRTIQSLCASRPRPTIEHDNVRPTARQRVSWQTTIPNAREMPLYDNSSILK
jgi:hypothetical protein